MYFCEIAVANLIIVIRKILYIIIIRYVLRQILRSFYETQPNFTKPTYVKIICSFIRSILPASQNFHILRKPLDCLKSYDFQRHVYD